LLRVVHKILSITIEIMNKLLHLFISFKSTCKNGSVGIYSDINV